MPNLMDDITKPNMTPHTKLVLHIARALCCNNENITEHTITRAIAAGYASGYITEEDGVNLLPGSYGRLVADVDTVCVLIKKGMMK